MSEFTSRTRFYLRMGFTVRGRGKKPSARMQERVRADTLASERTWDVYADTPPSPHLSLPPLSHPPLPPLPPFPLLSAVVL
jgi:hypothetical protein